MPIKVLHGDVVIEFEDSNWEAAAKAAAFLNASTGAVTAVTAVTAGAAGAEVGDGWDQASVDALVKVASAMGKQLLIELVGKPPMSSAEIAVRLGFASPTVVGPILGALRRYAAKQGRVDPFVLNRDGGLMLISLAPDVQQYIRTAETERDEEVAGWT